MKYVKQFVQETVKEENVKEFDMAMNAIYERAALGGKPPEVHYFDGPFMCATVRYFLEATIPETLADEYELRGERHRCMECPFFSLPKDRRIKLVKCQRTGRLVEAPTSACELYYNMLELEGTNEAKQIPLP